MLQCVMVCLLGESKHAEVALVGTWEKPFANAYHWSYFSIGLCMCVYVNKLHFLFY